jgi:hypothetical protein
MNLTHRCSLLALAGLGAMFSSGALAADRVKTANGQVTGFPYNIQPWAWDYLNKHKKLLD